MVAMVRLVPARATLLTTGGGGMILTGNAEWAARAKYLTTQAKDDPIEYVHHTVGYNYRLTNVQAAMGCAQMERLDEYIAAKRRIAAEYVGALADLEGFVPMCEAPWASSVFWMFTILLGIPGCALTSREMLARLQASNVQSRPLWQPLHRSPAHAGSQAIGGGVADRLFASALSLPCSVDLTDAQLAKVVAVIRANWRNL